MLLTSPKSEGAPQEAKIQGLISEYYSEDQGLEELRQKSARMWEKLKESICVETEGDAFNLKKLFMQEKKRKEEEEKKRIMKNSKILFALGRQRGLLPKTLEKAIIKVVGVARVPKENEVVQGLFLKLLFFSEKFSEIIFWDFLFFFYSKKIRKNTTKV